jgi:hypothetical protein
MSDSPVVRGFLILVIVALVGALAFFVYSLVSLPPRTEEPIRATETWTGEQRQTDFAAAEVQARERAQAWEADAVLIQAEGNWRIGEDWTDVETPPVAWFFSYYSTDAKQIATVGVSDDGIRWTSPRSVQVAPRPIATFPPAQGPETAWLSFRAYDGERFLGQQDGALVKLRLVQDKAGLIWRVSALTPPHQLTMKIDAATGRRMESQD